FVWRKRRKFDGQLFLFYLAWYGLGRVWIEGLRTDSLYLFGTGIRVSQLLAGLCALDAGGILIVLTIRMKPDSSKLYVNQKQGAEQTEATPKADAEKPADGDDAD
ncbi:MAG: prolipoprotein diacylglyceryl transferase, partial [Oscillospiraceae bacterium]|nr:prolipoprotein diacylglyceryl transferase [Oscillospiraceae bacterium]